MKTAKSPPAFSLALVIAAAGVVTASPELTLDAVGEFTPAHLAAALLGSLDQPAGRR